MTAPPSLQALSRQQQAQLRYVGRHRTSHRPSRPLPGNKGFRPDIEGLRAFAVGLVFLDHLAGHPASGFIGVDVFFVISGYLITGLLIKDTQRRGRLSFAHFYERRARRILPASLVVLAAVAVAAHVIFRAPRVGQTMTDIRWALGFSANIHFARIGTDYFQADRPPSLVQHFWSLAVEEQFYLVWPVIVLLVLSVVARHRKPETGLRLLLGVALAGCAASFAWALHRTHVAIASAYFSTAVRAWELGAGAALAVAVAAFPGLFRRLARVAGPLSLAGLATVMVSAFVVPAASGFPAPGAALPVAGTVLVLAAGVRDAAPGWTWPLTNPVSRYLGRVSYSLYLWHWPVILVTNQLVNPLSRLRYPIVVTAALGLSVLSYHLVEAPLRGISREHLRKVTVPGTVRASLRRNARVAAVGIGLLAIAGAGVEVRPASSYVPPRPTASAALASISPFPVVRPSPAIAAAIASAVTAPRFPTNIDPSLDTLTFENAHDSWDGCERMDICTFGDPHSPKVAVVLGDSYAMAYMQAIKSILLPQGYVIYGVMRANCPVADVPVNFNTNPPQPDTGCDGKRQWRIDQVNRINPRLIILASSDENLYRLRSGARDQAAEQEYQAGITRTITALQPSPTRRIVTFSPPPTSKALGACVAGTDTPATCVAPIAPVWRYAQQAEVAAAKVTKTDYLDLHLLACTTDGICPAFAGHTAIRWDYWHFTTPWARTIAPDIGSALRAIGLV